VGDEITEKRKLFQQKLDNLDDEEGLGCKVLKIAKAMERQIK
jgi:hypothetical protein